MVQSSEITCGGAVIQRCYEVAPQEIYHAVGVVLEGSAKIAVCLFPGAVVCPEIEEHGRILGIVDIERAFSGHRLNTRNDFSTEFALFVTG